MMDAPQVTILIPSHREGRRVIETIALTEEELGKLGITSYEMLAINCFHDNDETHELLRREAVSNTRIRYIQNKTCTNLGVKYREGIREARGEYFMFVPGDNETRRETFRNIFSHLGAYDIVITYTENPEVRSYTRRIASWLFVRMCRFISGIPLRYWNGINLYRTEHLRSIVIKTDGFSYSAEILMKLLLSGKAKTYIEVPMPINPPEPGRTAAAFRWRNIRAVSSALARLFWAVRVKRDVLA